MPLMNSKDVEFRIYDGSEVVPADAPPDTAPLPRYLVGIFITANDVVAMPPRPEERYYSNRGQADDFHDFLVVNDDATFQPLPWSFSYLLHSELTDFARMMGNPSGELPWEAFGRRIQPVTRLGTRTNSRGVEVVCKPPNDDVKRRFLVNIAIGYRPPPGAATGRFIQYYRGVCLSNRRIGDEPPAIRVTNDVMIYGAIELRESFPSGIEIVP